MALAAPEHEADLVQTGRYIAAGREEGGEVLGLHLVEVPLHTPLEMAGEQPREPHFIEATITAELEARQASEPASPLGRTSVEVFTDFTHDVPDALVNETSARGADMLLMGWEGEFSLRRVLEHPVQRVMSRIRADLGVLKARASSGWSPRSSPGAAGSTPGWGWRWR